MKGRVISELRPKNKTPKIGAKKKKVAGKTKAKRKTKPKTKSKAKKAPSSDKPS